MSARPASRDTFASAGQHDSQIALCLIWYVSDDEMNATIQHTFVVPQEALDLDTCRLAPK